MFWEVLVARIRACTHSPRKNLVYAFDQRKNKKTVKMLVFKVVHVYLNIHICTDSLCPTWIKSGSFAVRVSETTLPTLHHLVIANSLWLRCLFFAWPSWGHLWASWGHLGASLGPSWAIGAILGPSWGHLGASWGHVVPSWGHLGPSWDLLGPSWGHLGPSWGFLGPSWVQVGGPRGGPTIGFWRPF